MKTKTRKEETEQLKKGDREDKKAVAEKRY